MKHKTFGAVAILGIIATAGCYSYASEALNNGNYNTLQATPVSVVVNVGDSDAVVARLVNDFNNGAITDYTVSAVGAGILVHENVNYRPVYNSAKDTLVQTGAKDAEQFFVVGVTPGSWSFVLTPTMVNTGVSTTVKVIVKAKDLGHALSENVGAAGDTVVIHAPVNTVFSQTSAVTFTTGTAVVVARAADSSSITIVVGPGVTGPATITKIGQKLFPTIPAVTLVSADSLVTPALSVAPTTVSSTTPAIGVPVTVTLGGGLRFLANSHVFIGTREAGIASVSADSSTATIVPMLGSTGTVNYTNIALSFLTTVPVTLNGDKSITVGSTYAGPTDPNGTASATATTLTLPVGRSIIVSDNGPFTAGGACTAAIFGGGTTSCRWYKVVTTAANTFTGELRWDPGTSTDLGLYVIPSTLTGAAAIADNAGTQTGGPETGSSASKAAGTYFIVIVNYSATNPAFYQFRLSQP